MSRLDLQEYRHERKDWAPIALDRVRFNGSAAVRGGLGRILMNISEVFQNGRMN